MRGTLKNPIITHSPRPLNVLNGLGPSQGRVSLFFSTRSPLRPALYAINSPRLTRKHSLWEHKKQNKFSFEALELRALVSAKQAERPARRALAQMCTAGSSDLLVVGAGVLGTLIGRQWLQEHPDSRVVGQTRTEKRHSEIASFGMHPIAGPPMLDGSASERALFPFVVFCAPPYGNDDYVGAVRDATQSWNKEGCFLFTSSSGLYDVSDNGPCREEDSSSPSVPFGRSARLDTLLSAEEASLSAGGNAVRLAGLYTKDRGAHTFWLKKGTVESRPDHFLNLIHYEDAASLCIAILSSGAHGRIFMGCDNHPVSRQELMDMTVRSGLFEGQFNAFTGTDDALGKRMDNSGTRKAVGWKPRYESFESFLTSAVPVTP